MVRNVIEMNGSSGISPDPGCDAGVDENFISHNEQVASLSYPSTHS